MNVDIQDKKKVEEKFRSVCLDEASFIETVTFSFDNSKNYPDAVANGKIEYKIDGCCGALNYLFTRRDTLSKHKSELAYVVDEIERLRKYEVNKENWNEIIDSWIAFKKMSFKTKKAAKTQNFLFELEDSKQLMIMGKVLYYMEDEPPHGLLTKIKKHVGNR